jgi:hypothetical protein
VWGVTTNANLGTAIEQAIVGTATCVTADFTFNVATYVLTDTNASQTARAFVLDVTATLSAAGTINVPAIQKPYLVFNNSVGGFAVTVKVSGQPGVSIPNGKKAWLYNTGTDVGVAFDYAPTLTLGTPLLPASGGTGINSLGAGVATWLQTPSSTNLQAAVTDETGSGTLVFSNSPTLVTPNLGVPSFVTLTNATGLPLTTGVTGTLLTGNGGTGVNSYTAGDITYYAAGTALTKLPIGTVDYVLTSTGSAPQWSPPSSVVIGTANNLAGGATGSVPYQSAVSTTTFLGLGTLGQVMTAGASGPAYVDQSTLSVGSATNATNATNATLAVSATNVAGGTTNQLVYQTGAGATSFAPAPTVPNYVLTWSGSAFVWSAVPPITSAGNLVGGAAGDLVYQSATNVSAFLPDVATGNALITGGVGVAPSYGKIGLTTHVSGILPTANGGTNLSSFTSGGAVYATSTSDLTTGTLPIASGGTNSTSTPTAGAVAYGTGTAFAFSTTGTAGQALVSTGAGAPTWQDFSSVPSFLLINAGVS